MKPEHPVSQPCCGGTKVDDIVHPERKSGRLSGRRPHAIRRDVTQVWTEDRATLPEFLKDKGVSMELWQATHDDVVAHYKSFYNCCNAFWLNLFWYVLILIPLFIAISKRANFESGFARLLSKHKAAYKKCGLKVTVVMAPDKCGREKTVGLRFVGSETA